MHEQSGITSKQYNLDTKQQRNMNIKPFENLQI